MALADEIELCNPFWTPWQIWAADLCEQLSSYNAPRPRDEADWATWAADVCALPEIAELGVQTPEKFAGWREWGAALLQVIA